MGDDEICGKTESLEPVNLAGELVSPVHDPGIYFKFRFGERLRNISHPSHYSSPKIQFRVIVYPSTAPRNTSDG